MLRYESPVPFVPRVAVEDTDLGGCPIAAGDTVMLLLGSANSDERAIERADEVDFDRTTNRHLAFGGGVHRCLGSHLARLELRVSLREWHRRIPEYHIPEEVELEYATLLRQVEHLPLVFDTGRRIGRHVLSESDLWVHLQCVSLPDGTDQEVAGRLCRRIKRHRHPLVTVEAAQVSPSGQEKSGIAAELTLDEGLR